MIVIAATIPYDSSAKEMWQFLCEAYSHDKFQFEEELYDMKQRDINLPIYYATPKATCDKIRALHPPCKHLFKIHYERWMVAKFLSGLFPEYSIAKTQIVIDSEILSLHKVYNHRSCL